MASAGFAAIFLMPPPHCFDQHGTALPAADTFGGDAAFVAEPFMALTMQARCGCRLAPTGWPTQWRRRRIKAGRAGLCPRRPEARVHRGRNSSSSTPPGNQAPAPRNASFELHIQRRPNQDCAASGSRSNNKPGRAPSPTDRAPTTRYRRITAFGVSLCSLTHLRRQNDPRGAVRDLR